MDKRTHYAIWNAYYQRAKKNNITFSLTKKEFYFLISLPCFYCQKIFDFKTKKSKYSYMGIDRVDNSIGYLWENCVPCCKKMQ
jgi:hypothetical protein